MREEKRMERDRRVWKKQEKGGRQLHRRSLWLHGSLFKNYEGPSTGFGWNRLHITQSVIQDRSYDSYVSTYLICSLTSGFSDLSDSDVKSAMHRDFLNYFNLKDNRLE